MMKIVAIVQARMGSTRLPGKVMEKIGGEPMLYHVIKRAQKAKNINLVVVATSTASEDDQIETFCNEEGIRCFRGNETDVLDRYYQTAIANDADVIVRLTADCPVLDSDVVDKVVDIFLEGKYDYVSNTIKPTYPDGLDTEVFSIKALENAWTHAKLMSEREHVTPFIHKNPDLFGVFNLINEPDLSDFRWTVDEPADLKFIRKVFSYFDSFEFGMKEILLLLSKHPEIVEINSTLIRNEGYQKSLREDHLFDFKEGK